MSPIQACHPDADLAVAIHATLAAMPIPVEISWIKGHQDRTRHNASLPLKARLNVLADHIATNYLQRRHDPSLRSQFLPPIIPRAMAGLYLQGHYITSQYKVHLRSASLLPALRHYICKKQGWTHSTWNAVHWAPYRRAISSLKSSQQVTFTKFLHRWLPTSATLHKRDNLIPPTCPLCNAANETTDHVCLCTHPSVASIRAHATTNLRTKLTTAGTDPALVTILSDGIDHWMQTGQRQLLIHPPDTHPFSSQIADAIAHQNLLGWDQFLRGRISQHWATCQISWQHQQLTPRGPRRLHDADSWATLVVKWGISTFFSLWTHRNETAHTSVPTHTDPVAAVRLKAKVRDLYSRKDDLPQADIHAYFSMPLSQFLSSSLHTLTVWIAHVDRIFIRHRKEIRQRQRRGLITFFFHPATTT
jgi:hypothetical protein